MLHGVDVSELSFTLLRRTVLEHLISGNCAQSEYNCVGCPSVFCSGTELKRLLLGRLSEFIATPVCLSAV